MITAIFIVVLATQILLIIGGIIAMATLQDLDAALTSLNATVTAQTAAINQLSTDVTALDTAVDALIAKIQGGGTDFTNEINAVVAAQSAVTASQATVQTADSAAVAETTKAQGA
jgi:hypothetical protein